MGIFSPTSGGAWVQLADETLAADGTFDISGISQIYNHLYITILVRSDAAAAFDVLDVIFNGDTTAANYAEGDHTGGDFHLVAATDTNTLFLIAAASSPANYFSTFNILIPFYTVAQNKTAYAQGAVRLDTGDRRVVQVAFFWEDTAAINQIAVQTDGTPAQEIIAGSKLIMWGIT